MDAAPRDPTDRNFTKLLTRRTQGVESIPYFVGEISVSLYVNTIDLQSIEHSIESAVYFTSELTHI